MEAGDVYEPISTDPQQLKGAQGARLYASARDNTEQLKKAVATSVIAESWRGYFKHRLEMIE